MSVLIILRYLRSFSTADRTKFIEENKDVSEEIICSLGKFDLVMLGFLKWEHDNSLLFGIIEEMIGFFKENQIERRIRLCCLLEGLYARQPWAVSVDYAKFRVTVGEFCKRLEDYAKIL